MSQSPATTREFDHLLVIAAIAWGAFFTETRSVALPCSAAIAFLGWLGGGILARDALSAWRSSPRGRLDWLVPTAGALFFASATVAAIATWIML